MASLTRVFVLLATAFLLSCGNSRLGIPLAATTKAEQQKASGFYQTGVNLEAAGKSKQALKAYRKILTDFPLSEAAPEAAYREANILERRGDILEAFEAYQTFLKKYPGSPRYASAIKKQENIAHAAANGQITNSFIGMKSRVESSRVAEMLAGVRDAAPRSPSASRAQFTIGQLWQRNKQAARAIEAYRKVTSDFPNSREAPEAQFRIGETLGAQLENGVPDPANIDRAKSAYDDLLLRYPNHPRAKDAKAALAKLQGGDLQRSFDLGEFYRKKGQPTSAVFYYNEVVRISPGSALARKAQGWIGQLTQG